MLRIEQYWGYIFIKSSKKCSTYWILRKIFYAEIIQMNILLGDFWVELAPFWEIIFSAKILNAQIGLLFGIFSNKNCAKSALKIFCAKNPFPSQF